MTTNDIKTYPHVVIIESADSSIRMEEFEKTDHHEPATAAHARAWELTRDNNIRKITVAMRVRTMERIS